VGSPNTRTVVAGHIIPAKVLIKSGATNFFSYSTQDRKSVSTFKHFIATIQHDDFLHPLDVKQGYIDNGLRDTEVNEYIKQTYGSLLGFLQDSAKAQEFKLTEDKQANFN
jgi:hypothetical protein